MKRLGLNIVRTVMRATVITMLSDMYGMGTKIWIQGEASAMIFLCPSCSNFNFGSHIQLEALIISGSYSALSARALQAKRYASLISIPTISQLLCSATTVGTDRKHFVLNALIHHS